MGPEVAAAASIGGLALDAGSSIIRAQGENATQDFLAARDRRAAELGRIKADQTDAALRTELNTTLANIDVTRAAAGTDPTSPTALAIREHETEVSDRQRRARLAGIQAQVSEDEASASYRRAVGENALMAGYLSAAGKVGQGLGRAKAFGSYG